MGAGPVLPDRERWQRLDPLLDELLDLERSARAARLRTLHHEDPALARELGALCDAIDGAGSARFLDGVAGRDAALRAAPAGLAGHRFGDYTIVSLLGQGGTGSVWRARRADGRFEAEAAIKLLHLSLLGQSGARRFHREGQILARLAHPRISRLLDAGVGEQGQPYLVIELVEGTRIDRHCDAGRLTLEQRVELFCEVLGAVAHAHGQLVVHRDLKPTNILVDGDGHVKLLDFGIAKLLEDTHDVDATPITRANARALTPEYAAPEQLRGEPVSTTTDVYSLGVLLFQLATGRHPTAPDSATAPQVIRNTLEGQPLALAAAITGDGALAQAAELRSTTPRRLLRQLEGDLQNIVALALRKEAAGRYASAEAMADDLRRWLAHAPVRARADSFAYRTAKFVRRHRRAVVLGALAGAAVVAGLAGTVTQARRAQEQAARADAAAQAASHERDRAVAELTYAEASEEFVHFLLAQPRSKTLGLTEVLRRGEAMLERQFAEDHALRAKLQLMVSDLYDYGADADDAEPVLLRARASAHQAGDAALMAQIDCTLTARRNYDGRAPDALKQYDEAIARLDALPDADRDARIDCLNLRAWHHVLRGEGAAALADAQAALQRLGPTPRPGQRATAAIIRGRMAYAMALVGDNAQALATARRSIDELEGMGRNRTDNAVNQRAFYGALLLRAGLVRQAAEVFEAALAEDIDPKVRDLSLAPSYARTLMLMGRRDEARRWFDAALLAARRSGMPRDFGHQALLAAQGACDAGRVDRCSNLLAEARQSLTGVLQPGHTSFGIVELVAAQVSLARHAPARAREQLRAAVAIFDAAGNGHTLRIDALAQLARLDLEHGDVAAARRDAARAVTLARHAARGIDASCWLGIALAAQALVQQHDGDGAAARVSLTQALAQLQPTLGDEAPATRETRALLARAGG